jgi:flagellin-like protein
MRYTETTKDDSAVSPVIGVILMVAITVILAAVIGTFVLGLGEQVEQNARAGVNADVDASNTNVTLSVTTLDNSDYVLIRGPVDDFQIDGNSISNDALILNTTGQTAELSDADDSGSGTLTVVAVIGSQPSGGNTAELGSTGIFETSDPVPDGATETTVQQVDYDF